MTRQLTARQAAILRYIIRYKCDHDGDSPTMREIMQAVGITAVSIVHHNLDALERRGHIQRRGTKARSISVPGGRYVYEGVEGK